MLIALPGLLILDIIYWFLLWKMKIWPLTSPLAPLLFLPSSQNRYSTLFGLINGNYLPNYCCVLFTAEQSGMLWYFLLCKNTFFGIGIFFLKCHFCQLSVLWAALPTLSRGIPKLCGVFSEWSNILWPLDSIVFLEAPYQAFPPLSLFESVPLQACCTGGPWISPHVSPASWSSSSFMASWFIASFCWCTSSINSL